MISRFLYVPVGMIHSHQQSFLSCRFMAILVLLFAGVISSGCSMEATINAFSKIDYTDAVSNQNRKDPDLIYGEVVTTSSGFQFTGVFGEISEKTTSLNGTQWQFEGVFYE